MPATIAAFVSLLLAAAPPAAHAALERVRLGLMSLEAPPSQRATLNATAMRAANILPRIERDLGIRATSRFRMLLVPPGGGDPELRRIDAGPPEWAAGYTIPGLRLCAIRIAQAGRYPYGSIESVLAHEATHLMLHDTVGGRLPLWFEEGVATWEGRRWEFRDALLVSQTVLTQDLPALASLDSLFHSGAGDAEIAYAAAHGFVARTVHRYGPVVLRELIRESARRPFPVAWSIVTGSSLEHEEAAWRRDSLIRYRWLPLLTASSTLWILITFLALLAGARKRARAQRQREAWAAEEAAGAGEFVEPLDPGASTGSQPPRGS